MKRYRTIRSSIDIEEHEITRETGKSVWFMAKSFCIGRESAPVERKAAKVSDWHRWHDTWEAAHAYLLQRAEEKLKGARRALQLAQSEHGNVVGMKKPQA
jgi:hypothetical protein